MNIKRTLLMGCLLLLTAVRLLAEDFTLKGKVVDEEGNAKLYDCGKTKFNNDPARVDTLVLAENFTFPVCNYDQTNMKFTVKLKCNILARETSTFSREMFLDCIYLRPRRIEN